jgi:hypothetical protein
MKTYDFTAPVSPAVPVPAPRNVAPADTEDGWSAYERWLRRMREQLGEEQSPVPRDSQPD